MLEQIEIVFWHSFIQLASSLRGFPKTAEEWQSNNFATPNPSHRQWYLLFSAVSLLCGVLLGFLFGHLF